MFVFGPLVKVKTPLEEIVGLVWGGLSETCNQTRCFQAIRGANLVSPTCFLEGEQKTVEVSKKRRVQAMFSPKRAGLGSKKSELATM